MRLLRTATGEFINAAAIARFQRDRSGAGWLAILVDGNEMLLAPYFSASGRIEQYFSHLVQVEDVAALLPIAACQAAACCVQ
jgi:hypothetical protein